MGFLVPLSFENLGKGMMMSETDTRDVMITVDGPLSRAQEPESRRHKGFRQPFPREGGAPDLHHQERRRFRARAG